MANHIFVLVAIMLMSGVFGGLLNYYLQAQADSDNSSMPRSVIGGLAASFLVPLILFLVSSDLVVSSQGDPAGMLIFAGFCLIAAWSSRFIMSNVTKRVILQTQMACARVDQLMTEITLMQRELEPLLEMETEGEGSEDTPLSLSPKEELDVTTGHVLTALNNGRYIFRSISGLASETELDEHKVSKTLSIIVARDLGGKILSKKGMRWYINQKGRRYLASAA